ncbi:PQQ-binding-like beta-propeller repeat protein [Streptomyces sp. NPDC051985]|uniref:outer membrane protein assembly factor BamB family protein n=1 Tax=Streptomyces sp. NPDC051985 TaxID=3155807 RepID=UPI003449A686
MSRKSGQEFRRGRSRVNTLLYVAIVAVSASVGVFYWITLHAVAGYLESLSSGDHGMWGGPVVSEGHVYVGTRDRTVRCLDAASGAVRWSRATGSLVAAAPAISYGTVYVGSEDGKVHAFDASTGKVRWTHATGGAIVSSPAVKGGMVYVGSDDHTIYALDAATGTLRWRRTVGDRVESSPSIASGTVYIGSNDDSVYALDAARGKVRWTHSFDGDVDTVAAVGGRVFVGSADFTGYQVSALDAASGALRWTRTGGYSDLAVANGTLYANNDTGDLYALDAASGTTRWVRRNPHADGVSGVAIADRGTVYVAGWHRFFALDAATGRQRWSSRAGQGWGWGPAPAVLGTVVFVSDRNGVVYALNRATGRRVFTSRPPGRGDRPATSATRGGGTGRPTPTAASARRRRPSP